MHPETEAAILKRLERLERQNRLWRLALITVTCLAVATASARQVTAQGPGTTLKAPVTVVDPEGHKLAVLKDVSGAALLQLFGRDGTAIMEMDGTEGGTIHINDVTGKPCVVVSPRNIAISHPAGRVHASLSVSNAGGMLTMSSGELPTVALDTSETGGALRLSNGKNLTASLNSRGGTGNLLLTDGNGKTTFSAP